MTYGRKQCDPISGCGTIYNPYRTTCPKCGASDAFSQLVPFDPRDWIYDLENYPNIFTASFKHMNTCQRLFYEVSERKNQLGELIQFLQWSMRSGVRHIGFNNLGYDYPIIHYILQNGPHLTNQHLFAKGDSIINTPWERRFDNVIWDSDVLIPQIDLFKIHHFDNENRRTSLKMLEFNMRMESVEDLPFPPAVPIPFDGLDTLGTYNDHDVDATGDFYIESIEMIEFREQLSEKYGKNLLNHSDKKIGTEVFIHELEKHAPGSCYYKDETGRKRPRQTPREIIHLKDVIFPYIQFKTPIFHKINEWLKTYSIRETKGALEYLNITPEMAFSMNPEYIKVYNLTPTDVPSIKANKLTGGVLLSSCRDDLIHRNDLHRFKFVSGWKKQSGLNAIIDGFEFSFGTGGIHGSIDSATVCADDDYAIFDWDVAGYYPSLGSVNHLYPKHLSEQFCAVDSMLKEERAKHDKGTPLNTSIKLARNGAYGDSNNQYSPFLDPQYTMSITINGQLLLCLLAEYLTDLPGLQMIQINTDGLTVRVPRHLIDAMNTICEWWQGFTCLELEHVEYSRMFIRDVNNYIAETTKGKLKRKGAYGYETPFDNPNTGERLWHKNHSSLVIPKAAEAALVHGEDIAEFIYNHADVYDFMLGTKIGRSDLLILADQTGGTCELQKITRYYVAKQGGTMTKVSPPVKGMKDGQWKRANGLTNQFYDSVIAELRQSGSIECGVPGEYDTLGVKWDPRINTKNKSKYEERRTDINAGYLVAPCNNIHDADRSNINYDYYIAEAHKLVDPLRGVS